MILDANPKYVSDADKDCSARRNPIYVTRVLSAMVGPHHPPLLKESRPLRMAINQPLNGFSVRDYQGARENFQCAYIYSTHCAGKMLLITLRLSLFLRATRFCDRNKRWIVLKQHFHFVIFLLKNQFQNHCFNDSLTYNEENDTPAFDTAQTAGLMQG